MGKWEMVRLGDVTKLFNGFAFDSKYFNNDENGMPLVRIRDVVRGFTETYTTEECKEDYVVKRGDLLIGMDGEFNIAPWNSVNGLLNQRVCKITSSSPKLNNHYLYYCLPKVLKDIEEATSFVTVKHLSSKKIANIEISLPPLPEQQQIADVLDRASTLIEKRKALIAKLDLLIKSQFIEMFSCETNIPKPLKEIADVMGGLTKNTGQKVTGKEYPFLRVANVYTDRFDFSEVHSIVVEENKVKRVLLRKGDLLFVEGNGSPTQIGRVAVWEGQIEPCVHQNHLIKVRFNGEVNPVYAKFYFMTPLGREQIVRLASSTSGLYTLNLEKIGSVKLPIPTLKKQNQFVYFVHKVDEQKSLLQQSLAKLEQNYKALMQKCYRGEIF